jgi:hypothetical protein
MPGVTGVTGVTGGGGDVGAAAIVKLTGLEMPPPGAGVTTFTGTVLGATTSAAVMVARSSRVLTNVVGRAVPFQRTTEEPTKPRPLTVSVKLALPAVTLDGETPLGIGAGAGCSGRSTRVLSNVAMTVVAPFIVHAQVSAVPLQAPLQPLKVEPNAAAAVSVIGVPDDTVAAHSVPHAIPAVGPVTVPSPVPVVVTESSEGGAGGSKLAVTVVAAFTVTTQAAVPLHAPPQPMKIEPPVGAAVRVNCVPGFTVSEQSAPQAIPAGELVTVPEPAPPVVTESVTGAGLNVAVTVVAAFTVTAQAPVPLHAPLQPAKTEPAVAVAVSVNGVPGATDSEQSDPHEMPAGALVTVPAPVPLLVTVSVTGLRLNVAVTVVAALTVTAQVPVPLQAPLQPANVEPAAALAVRANCAPGVTDSEQSDPHDTPAGALETVPVPVPLFATVSVTGVRLNVAVTVVAVFTVATQVPVPLQPPPLQPAKVAPAVGAAVRVNWVPGATVSEQSLPQEMPAGVLVTVPVPLPFLATVSVTGV